MTTETTTETVFYGACGNERCTECRPFFDAGNVLIPGTDTDTEAAMHALALHLGRHHKRAGSFPFGDLDAGGEALLMDALGETGPTTADNHARRLAMVEAYRDGIGERSSAGTRCEPDCDHTMHAGQDPAAPGYGRDPEYGPYVVA